MVFISNGQCMLWSQSVGNVFSNDLEIQIYLSFFTKKLTTFINDLSQYKQQFNTLKGYLRYKTILCHKAALDV